MALLPRLILKAFVPNSSQSSPQNWKTISGQRKWQSVANWYDLEFGYFWTSLPSEGVWFAVHCKCYQEIHVNCAITFNYYTSLWHNLHQTFIMNGSAMIGIVGLWVGIKKKIDSSEQTELLCHTRVSFKSGFKTFERVRLKPWAWNIEKRRRAQGKKCLIIQTFSKREGGTAPQAPPINSPLIFCK